MSKWNVDVTHTNVSFEIKHMIVSKVRRNFSDMEGTIEGDPRELENTKINFRVGIDSISTNNEDRDNHLRSADFFEAEKYPNMTFESTNIKKVGDNQYELTGNLTIKDVTKETNYDVEYLGEGRNHCVVEVVGC